MERDFTPTRTARRLAPKQSATAAVYQGEVQLAYGVLTNISEAGACIVTDSFLPAGATITLKLSFYQQPELFETSARVIWHRKGAPVDEAVPEFRLLGMKFTEVPENDHGRLTRMLQTDDFHPLASPPADEFGRLQQDLFDELEKLGAKIGKSIGQDQ